MIGGDRLSHGLAPKPTFAPAGHPESSHPNSAMSICRDWKLQPPSHQQIMNLT
jgi:hypothetical protein